MTIADLTDAGKAHLGRIPGAWLIAGIVILSSTASFGLGILEGKGQAGSNLTIGETPTTTPLGGTTSAYTQPAAAAAAVITPIPVTAPVATDGQVVAAKTGSKYYFPWCGTVKLIKEENKVWFPTRAAAEAAGYTAATNCKGM